MFKRKVKRVVGQIPVIGPKLQKVGEDVLWRFREKKLEGRTAEDIFAQYYKKNHWGDAQSRSGQGSSLDSTILLRQQLPSIWRDLMAKNLIDVPCGDFTWMKHVDLTGFDYLGADIVADMIENNRENYERLGISFQKLDVIHDRIPSRDLIFCRDCLVHFSFADIGRTVANIRKSGAQWLMTTHFPKTGHNVDIPTGFWRPIDLQRPPFCFPPPLLVIPETSDLSAAIKWPDKSLAVWAVSELPTSIGS